MVEGSSLRRQMVKDQLAARGITDPKILDAMRRVPRDAFVSLDLVEFAYEDSPLPIGEEQTISQPFMVALMTDALDLSEEDRVLEVGTGSGYAAAVLAEIAKEVYTVERHASLAEGARKRLDDLGYDNIWVRHGDGTLGWGEHAPYDAIVVAAGGPDIPEPLKDQLAIGGTLVIPTGSTPRLQKLVRVHRISEDEYLREDLGHVRFVPLVGKAGWQEESAYTTELQTAAPLVESLPEQIAEIAEVFQSIPEAKLDGLLDRIGNARVVLLGESTHGTSEFYRMRAHITQKLLMEKGFNIVAVEADWPDASRVNDFIHGKQYQSGKYQPFSRFPTWMWANTDVVEFANWLREYNHDLTGEAGQVGFYGLDLYSMYSSIEAVLGYLDGIDPETARIARQRYGCLTPWEQDPASYGQAAISGKYQECEEDVISILGDLMSRRMEFAEKDGQEFFNAAQNARLVANAEKYYRVMYYSSRESWNLRDLHMFDTLRNLLAYRGEGSRAVVWAHNSHIGDAAATEMGARREYNIGQLCRERLDDRTYHIGFGTDHGTVAAASYWDGPMEIKDIRPGLEGSYEWLYHLTGTEAFLLPFGRDHIHENIRRQLLEQRLERAIGVIYRPQTELQSHYFHAVMPRQFDELIWFDETHAVRPIEHDGKEGVPETFPFGL